VIEQRGSPRQNKCFFRAFAYFEGSGIPVDCIVRDISETGARLQFPRPQKFSEFLDLHIPIKGQSFHSKVRWEDGNEVGVVFHVLVTQNSGDIRPEARIDQLEAEIAMLRRTLKRIVKNTDQNPQSA
jgi:hypothetical protein